MTDQPYAMTADQVEQAKSRFLEAQKTGRIEVLPYRPSLEDALAAFQAELPSVAKNKTAVVKGETRDLKPFNYTYKYADYADVAKTVMPLLGKHGLSFTAQPTMRDNGQFGLAYQLLHTSGQRIEGWFPLDASKKMQTIGGDITYARRYCLSSVTGVAAEEDTDAQGSDESQDSPPQKRGRRQPPPERAPDALPRNRDGSVSRSQATDTELAAAGNMTDAQIREHNRLEREVKGTGPQGTERLTGTPDDDPWQLPVPRASQPIDRRIIMHFQRLGVTADQRDLRLQMTAELAGSGVAINSTKQLSAAEGITVERLLARCRDRGALDALLDTMTPAPQPSPPKSPVAVREEAGPAVDAPAGPAVQRPRGRGNTISPTEEDGHPVAGQVTT